MLSCAKFLSVNVKKSYAMLLNMSSNDKPSLMLNNTPLAFTETAVSLGFKIQSNFEWDAVVLQQCGKVYATLRSLKLSAAYLNVDIEVKLFKTLIFPHIIVCDLFRSSTSSSTFHKLRVALNECIRYVFNLSRYSCIMHLQHKVIGCSFNNFGKLRSCHFIHELIKHRDH